jgi:uncharacterized protein YndB with AHSA1/START domain
MRLFSRWAFTAALGTACLAFSSPLGAAEAPSCDGNGRFVRVEIEIAAPAEKVLNAFTNVEAMQDWWSAVGGLVEARPGGVWAVTWDASQFGFVALSGVVESLRPGERLRIGNLAYFNRQRAVLGPMALAVEVSESEGRSKLVVCQSGYKYGSDWEWYYELVRESWPPALVRLKKFLEAERR